jgi:hypothetical protein
MRRVVFVDESGTKSFCNCVVVAGLAAEVTGSYMYWGLDIVDGIRRRLGIAGELKWRRVKRRGGKDLVEALLWDFESDTSRRTTSPRGISRGASGGS